MPVGRPLVERVTVSCFVCGKDIEKRKSDAERSKSGRFFCSNECLRKVGSKPRRRSERGCAQCDAVFYPETDPDQRFCSKQCYDRWQRRNRSAKVCTVCGIQFWLKPSQVAHVTGRFCSRKCESASRIKRPLAREYNGRPAALDNAGYVRVFEPSHPKAMNGGWAFEHRLIVEKQLGRQLAPDEHVHHVNGKKDDNRPENLVVLGHSEHSTLTGNERQKELIELRQELVEYRKRFGSLNT